MELAHPTRTAIPAEYTYPVPPPVINTLFPLAESSGRVGDKDGYVSVCHFEVGDGNGAAIVKSRNLDVLEVVDSGLQGTWICFTGGSSYT